MPIHLKKSESGELLWIENPFTGVVTYLTDIHRKRSGFEAAKDPDPPPPAEILDEVRGRCQFCPGNEHLTTTEVLRREPATGGGWHMRAFYNLFPRIPEECTGGRNESYVLVETPDHFRPDPADLEDLEFTAALGRERFRDIVQDAAALAEISLANPAVQSVVVRKNQGRESGASQPHPHTQVIGCDRTLAPVAREREVLLQEPGLWHDILGLVESERLILRETEGCYLYFSPFAAFPRGYEIVDTQSTGPLPAIDRTRLALFADLLFEALEVLGGGPLDYEIHADEGIPLHAHVHSRFYPYANIAGTLNLPTQLLRRR